MIDEGVYFTAWVHPPSAVEPEELLQGGCLYIFLPARDNHGDAEWMFVTADHEWREAGHLSLSQVRRLRDGVFLLGNIRFPMLEDPTIDVNWWFGVKPKRDRRVTFRELLALLVVC